MKSFVCFSLLITTLVAATSITVSPYTQKSIDAFVDDLAETVYTQIYYGGEIDLHNLLGVNYNALDENGSFFEKTSEGKHAHHIWKAKLLQSPELGRIAIEQFGPYIIRQLNSRLNYLTLKTNRNEQNIDFEESTFWNDQLGQIKSYQRLTSVLLELSDSELNYFIQTNTSPASSFEFNKFLFSKHIVHNIEDSHCVDRWAFPGDLILLVKRTSEENSDWTPRRCLNTTNQFLDALSELIDNALN